MEKSLLRSIHHTQLVADREMVENELLIRNVKHTPKGVTTMGLLRGGLAGLGAWKWGGGLFGTIIVFLILYWLLGALGMQ